MNTLLRAKSMQLITNPFMKMMKQGAGMLCGLVVVAVLLFPFNASAALGFAGTTITPALLSGGATVCSGNSATITLNITTCPFAGDWSGNYRVDSSSDAGFSFHPVAFGVATGTANSTVSVINYVTPVYTNLTSSCFGIQYRFVFTGMVNMCSGGTGHTSPTALINICPSAGIVTGDTTVCVGQSNPYVSTVSGGTWSSSNIAIATVGSATGLVTGVAAGTCNITYTMAGGCFAVKATTVNAAASTIVGGPTVCVGGITTYNLAAPLTPGAWSSSNPAVGSIADPSGVFVGLSVGTTNVRWTHTNGCVSSFLVTVNLPPAPISCNTPICFGSGTINLCSATSGGTWVSQNLPVATVNISTGVVTPSNAGTATIVYSNLGIGCSVSTVVTINALPATITGTPTVCVGNTTTFSTTPTGGTWTSSNTAVGTIDATTGVITGISAGTSSITYTTTGGCTRARTVSVNTTPTPVSGPDAVCEGSTITMSSTPAGGAWSSSNTTVATIVTGTGLVTGASAGTSSILYNLGGCTASKTISVNVTPVALTGTQTVCVGFTTTFASTTSGGTWSSSNPAVATVGTSGVITGVTSGTSMITYQMPVTGCLQTRAVTVNILPTPITGPNNVCVGASISLASTPAGGVWSSGNIPVATVLAGTGVVTGGSAGTVNITYLMGSGCQAVYNVTVNPLPAAISGSSSACSGDVLTYSSATAGGTWSSSNTAVATVGTSGIITTLTVGTSNIIYTLPTGCIAVRTLSVNPAAAAITGPASVCQGSTITLATTTPGGNWTSDNASVATINVISGLLTGAGVGTANITYTLPAGCFSTRVMTVYALPTAITGAPSVCVGSNTTFFSTPAGGTWSSSNITIATVGSATGLITGNAIGTATITYQMPTGCFVTQNVTVNNVPAAITGATSVCEGSTITLSSSPSGGTWTSSNGSVATIGGGSGVLTGIGAGTVNISYTISGGCRSIITITVNALPAPITGTMSVCVGASTPLSSTTFGGAWATSISGVATVNASTGLVTGVSAGTAIISYTLTTGCYDTAVVTINATPSTIAGPSIVCVSTLVTFTSPSVGGTWSISPTSVATVGIGSGIVTGVAVGTAELTYTLPGGCLSITTITVSALPAPITGTAVVCVGNSTTFSSTTPGGVWSGLNAAIDTINSATGTATGVSAGSDIISYTLPSGCRSTIVLTVNPLPAPITGPTGVCMGSTVTLTSATAGVIWSSSIPPIADIGSSSGVVTPHIPGNTVITAVVPGTGCQRNIVFTVYPLPLPIGGTLSVCVGATTILSNPSPGSGTWSSSNPSIAGINSITGVVTGVTAGVTTITYTLSTGCSITDVVTVYPLPAVITGFASTCLGFCTTLSSATPGGVWSSPAPWVATINPFTGLLCGVTVGTTLISYTLPTGCAQVIEATVDPIPAPPTGSLSVCVGSTTTLSHTTPGGTWSSSDITVAPVFLGTGVVTGLSAGTANITYTTASGCTAFVTVTVNPVPPPSTGTFYMCAGATTTLFNIYPGGTWQSGSTGIAVVGSSTGVVSGVTAGVAPISYVLPSGCYTITMVTVYPLPTISGSALICPGVGSTLTGSPSGGIWSSSPTAIATIGSLSGVVNGISTGTAIVTYTLATSCLNTVIVSVQPLPASIVGPTQVCVGSTITLLNFTAGGGTWSSSNPAIGSIDTLGVVTGITAGVTIITFTANSTGCITTQAVTVNPLPGSINGPNQVCVGATIPLFDPTPGGVWSSGGTVATVGSSTGIVTGVAPGVETITYTLSTGCFVTYDVTVNPLPSVIAGSFSICHGYTTLVSSTPSGGVWSITPPTVATIDTAGVITAVSPGTATVTYSLPLTGCFSTAVITVNPLPAPITGILNICVNDTTTLYDTTSGGSWSSENIYIAVIDPTTGLLASVSAGTVTITYTLLTGCFVTTVMTINPLPPAITGTLSACVGQTSTLSNIITGGSWSSSNPAIATIGSASGVVTGIVPGTTVITYTLPSSCSRTAVFTVNPLPLPITGPLSICDGDTSYLSSPTPGGTWSSSNPSVAFIFMPTGQMIGLSVGTATITYMLPTGCFTAATVVVNPVPTNASILGNRVLCVGDFSTLTNPTFIGGTWSSLNPGIASIGVSSGTMLGVSAGTTIITFTAPTGCDTFITVTVNPLPLPITGILAICVGNSSTLSSATPGGTWSSSNAIVGTIDPNTGVFIGLSPGFTLITYKLTATGCQISAIMTVNPLPGAIVGNNHICLGDNTVLRSSSLGGGWSSSNTGIATVTAFSTGFDSALVSSVSAGIVTITYTLPTGCFTTFQMTVHPLPNPIIGADTVCVGGNITLASAPLVPPAGSVWSSSNTSIATIGSLTGIVTGVAPGTAIMTYTASFPSTTLGCYVTHLVNVRPNPTPIQGPVNVCVGFTITAIDTTLGGTWSTSNTSIATIGSSTGVITGVAPGSVTITYKLSYTQCYVTRVINVNPIPVVTVNHPTIICKHASVTLNATGAGPSGIYTWAPPTGLSSTIGASVVASPTITTTYTVTGTTIFGCPDTAQVTVVIDSMLNDIKIVGDSIICRGECTKLMASGREGTYFNWKPAIGLSCTICDTTTACPVQTVTYNAVAIDSMGCRDSLYFTVFVKPLPVMKYSPNPVFVCNGSTTQVNIRDDSASVSNVTRFAWFPNAFISCDTCPNPVLSNTFNLIYRVTGITPFGCMDSIRIPVTVLDSAFNSINRDTVVCRGSSAQLKAVSINPDGARSDFLWTTPGVSNKYIANPVVTPTVTTTYQVIITPNVCWPDTLYTTVVVAEYPDISISVIPTSRSVAPGTAVPMTATIENGMLIKSYAWSPPPTLSCEVCYHTIATPTVTTTYTFSATSIYGCTSTKDVTITVGCDESQVFIPNTFTPNGDGMNDRFYVSGKGIEKITKFSIYNRWGELVYERTDIGVDDPSVGWDGQYKGVVLSPDVFYYYVEAICVQGGTTFHYKGDVTLLR